MSTKEQLGEEFDAVQAAHESEGDFADHFDQTEESVAKIGFMAGARYQHSIMAAEIAALSNLNRMLYEANGSKDKTITELKDKIRELENEIMELNYGEDL